MDTQDTKHEGLPTGDYTYCVDCKGVPVVLFHTLPRPTEQCADALSEEILENVNLLLDLNETFSTSPLFKQARNS